MRSVYWHYSATVNIKVQYLTRRVVEWAKVPHTSAARRREDAPRESNLPTLQERKQQVVRSAIWDAAIDLFVEKGYDETTVDEVAERAGVSRRSFFRYFSSKSDLVSAGMATYG